MFKIQAKIFLGEWNKNYVKNLLNYSYLTPTPANIVNFKEFERIPRRNFQDKVPEHDENKLLLESKKIDKKALFNLVLRDWIF